VADTLVASLPYKTDASTRSMSCHSSDSVVRGSQRSVLGVVLVSYSRVARSKACETLIRARVLTSAGGKGRRPYLRYEGQALGERSGMARGEGPDTALGKVGRAIFGNMARRRVGQSWWHRLHAVRLIPGPVAHRGLPAGTDTPSSGSGRGRPKVDCAGRRRGGCPARRVGRESLRAGPLRRYEQQQHT